MQQFVYGLLLALMAARIPAGIEERAIVLEVELDAEVEHVWNARITPQGIRAFFAPHCHVDLRVGGLYETALFLLEMQQCDVPNEALRSSFVLT